MPMNNIRCDAKMNSGGAVYEPAHFAGSLDPDLAVGPGRIHQGGHGGLQAAPDWPSSTIRVFRIGLPPGRTAGNRIIADAVCGLA
jgi:hypothetical protein